jgi:hypothetical protein
MSPLKLKDPDNMMEVFMDAIHQMDLDDLAFLFATGKCELEIRNQIAIHLNRTKQPHQEIAREWARHDLAIFESGAPAVVVEGKAWLYADAVKEQKLLRGDKSIRHGLKADLKKLKATAKKYPGMQGYITMLVFSIDIWGEDDSAERNVAIKYESTHRQGLNKFDTLRNLSDRGRGNILDLLSKYGTVVSSPIKVGRYFGMEIAADFYLLKPTFE